MEAALPPAADGKATALRPLNIVPTNAPRVPRKVLRFQLSLDAMVLCSFLYIAHHGSNAIDFHERLARQSSNGHGGARRPAVREVGLEYGIHAVVIIQLRQEHGELKNTIHD